MAQNLDVDDSLVVRERESKRERQTDMNKEGKGKEAGWA